MATLRCAPAFALERLCAAAALSFRILRSTRFRPAVRFRARFSKAARHRCAALVPVDNEPQRVFSRFSCKQRDLVRVAQFDRKLRRERRIAETLLPKDEKKENPQRWELNTRPSDYKGSALPIEPHGLVELGNNTARKSAPQKESSKKGAEKCKKGCDTKGSRVITDRSTN